MGSAVACRAPEWFGAAPARLGKVLLAMVVARIVSPGLKLATHRMLSDDTAARFRGRVRGRGLGLIEPEELYRALDGLYVVRTRLSAEYCEANAVVTAYKSLAQVERAVRLIKIVDLHVRPVYHYSAERVKTHVFLWMLTYCVEWHMRSRLKPMLFDDEFIDMARTAKPSAVAKAQRLDHARTKDVTGRADDGMPLHSFRTLMQDLGTLAYNITHTAINPKAKIILTTRPSPVQETAFALLGINPPQTQ